MPSTAFAPNSQRLTIVDPPPQVATTPPPASPPFNDFSRSPNPITSPNASPIYPRMPVNSAKETIPQSEDGTSERNFDIPALKFSAAPTPSRSPPSTRHVAPVSTPKVCNKNEKHEYLHLII